jgi:hypothetical protein
MIPVLHIQGLYLHNVQAFHSQCNAGRIDRRGNVNVQINGSGFRVGNLEDLFTGIVEKVQRNAGSGIMQWMS